MKTILLPGGLGYIGTHTIAEIFETSPLRIVIVDNYSNCQSDILERLYQVVGEANRNNIIVRKGNILDFGFLVSVFEQQVSNGTPIEGIIHFAAKKDANESVVKPFLYFENNFIGSFNLLKVMQKFPECESFIFSSTAAVYGEQDNCTEQFNCLPITPYGESKFSVEMMLKDSAKIHPQWRIISLRYFNPVGCHQSGLIGDWPSNYPGNLFPVIQQFIIGKRKQLKVFGNDYPTKDGSGVRDFIHIKDLARGHVKALEYLQKMTNAYNYDVFNLGCGCGYSVLEVIECYEKSLKKKLTYQIAPRRQGDISKLVANVDKARQKLKWQAKMSLQQMCDSSVKFTNETLLKHFKQ